MADSIIVIFLIILSFISIFEVRTYMQYVFEKSLAETSTTSVIEKHTIFSGILYLYPWKYIKRYRFIFLLFQIMYFSYNSYEDISYDPVEYLQKSVHIFLNLLNDFQQRCNEQDIENTEEIVAYYRSELDNKHLQE